MEMINNRELHANQLVEVYYNIRKHVYSIRDKKSKLVLCHAVSVTLKNASFKISQKGRERVLREGVKNVHAYVVGEFICADKDISTYQNLKPAFYNPMKTTHFVDSATALPLNDSPLIHCQNKIAYYQL